MEAGHLIPIRNAVINIVIPVEPCYLLQVFFALLTLVFIVIAVVKLEINPLNLFLDSGTDEVSLQVAEDEDYEIFFKVNVSFANLRNKPNTKTSTILFVLTQGTQVEILEKKGKWSKIRSKPGPKEPARTGWLASKLVDSEIK